MKKEDFFLIGLFLSLVLMEITFFWWIMAQLHEADKPWLK